MSLRMEVTAPTLNRAERGIQLLFSDQLPIAYAQSINDSARTGQDVQRIHQRARYHIRKDQWVSRAVKIKPFAKKTSLLARVAVDPPRRAGEDRSDVLTQHEFGGRKTPVSGQTLGVPTEHVSRLGSGVIRKAWRPKELKRRRGKGSGRKRRWGGTFIREERGRDAIFERTKEGGLRPLYWLTEQVPLDSDLNFVSNITRSVTRTYPENFRRRFRVAVQTRR